MKSLENLNLMKKMSFNLNFYVFFKSFTKCETFLFIWTKSCFRCVVIHGIYFSTKMKFTKFKICTMKPWLISQMTSEITLCICPRIHSLCGQYHVLFTIVNVRQHKMYWKYISVFSADSALHTAIYCPINVDTLPFDYNNQWYYVIITRIFDVLLTLNDI